MRCVCRVSCVLVVLGIIVTLCSCSGAIEAEPVPAVADSETARVAVAEVTTDSMQRDIVLTGEFLPFQAVDVHAKVAGYLKEIVVDAGDRVVAGQTLATLEIPEMVNELASAEAAHRMAQADLERAKGELERAEADTALIQVSYSRLAAVMESDTGLVAQQELDEALARKRAAEAKVSAARAELSAAQRKIDVTAADEQRCRTMAGYSRITAPFTGVITKRFAHPGAMIQQGTSSHSQAMPVVRLAQIDKLRMVIPVPESEVSRISVGKAVAIRVRSLARSMEGRISRWTSSVDLDTRTMDVEVDVRNSGGDLKPGMYADARLVLEKHQDTSVVPVQATFTRGGSTYVLVATAAGVLEERQIEPGLENAEHIEVLSGVTEGEHVVIGNKGHLRPGQKIEAKVTRVG